MDNYIVQNKKKRKRRALVIFLALLGIALLIGGIIWYRKRAEEAKDNANAESAVKLTKDQSWKYYSIGQIIGNEVTATEIDEEGNEKGGEETFLIPVGTEVITSIESVTTFTRLSAGNVIHCLMQDTEEGPVIVRIWIAGEG